MHSRHIVHRDLKPANMLVAVGTAGDVNIVISDFGSSTAAVDPSNGEAGVTAVGTYQFRAPELFLARPACSYKSDVWAVGVNILQMDIMKLPFGKDALRRSQMFEVLFDCLRILTTWRKPQHFEYQTLRQRPRDFRLVARVTSSADSRPALGHLHLTGRVFDFRSRFLRIRAAGRPLATELLKHAYLKGVA